jgi:hypothetical protein
LPQLSERVCHLSRSDEEPLPITEITEPFFRSLVVEKALPLAGENHRLETWN